MGVGDKMTPEVAATLRRNYPEGKRVLKPDGTFYSQVTLDDLERIRLRADLGNMRKYMQLADASGLPRNRHVGDWTNMRSMAGLWSGSWRKINLPPKMASKGYKDWRVLGRYAKLLDIPMELLIDEDYYWGRSGFAGYRVLCEVFRQGVPLEELTYRKNISDNPKYSTPWFRMWRALLTCSWSDINRTRGDFFSIMLQQCTRILAIPMGELLSHRLYRCDAVGVFGELSNILVSLPTRECAMVAGFAKVVHDCLHTIPDPVERERVLQDYARNLVRFCYGKESNQGTDRAVQGNDPSNC